MNLEKVQAYIKLYKEHFQYLHEHEWYKWRAVKTFQDNWDIEAKDFSKMFEKAVEHTYNLLQGPNEYSRDIMSFYISRDAAFVRGMFSNLFDESKEITARVEDFTAGANELQQRFSEPGQKHHQTSRAIAAYLTLRYPDSYYFYKTKMVRKYFQAVDYPIDLNQNSPSKFTVYYHACDLLRAEIEKDQELIGMHLSRLGEGLFYDNSLHILTQDVIYAIAEHFPDMGVIIEGDVGLKSVHVEEWKKSSASLVNHKEHKPTFKGKHVDFAKTQKSSKDIGDKGELWVIQVEKQKLIEAGWHKKADEVEYVADTEGDGTGYDIRSFDKETGKEIFIEVKTTTGDWNTPFYLTRTEVERSKADEKKYRLYRVYNFNEAASTASIKEYRGDLSWMCTEPTQYVVNLPTT